jgi:uncharacterized repeat protein (TIGR04076 family)
MSLVDKVMKSILVRMIKNRWDYTNEEYGKASGLGFFDIFDLRAMQYWIVARPVCALHCSGCHHEGRPFYFNAMGSLIRHKCPPGICIHGLSQLSPIIYNYYDHLLQGKNPNDMVFSQATCTDMGLEMGGLGSNIFSVTYEKMPVTEFWRLMLTMRPYVFFRNRKARGRCQAIKEAPITGGPEPNGFMKSLPIGLQELEAFLASPQRVKRLHAAEKFRNHRIVVKVVSSNACVAGHKAGDEFIIDSIGRVQPPEDRNGICIMALTKIWWRVMLMLERMAGAGESEGNFSSTIFGLPMNCYGAGLPLGACGEILMTVEVREPASTEQSLSNRTTTSA